jgi:hypothetical protein
MSIDKLLVACPDKAVSLANFLNDNCDHLGPKKSGAVAFLTAYFDNYDSTLRAGDYQHAVKDVFYNFRSTLSSIYSHFSMNCNIPIVELLNSGFTHLETLEGELIQTRDKLKGIQTAVNAPVDEMLPEDQVLTIIREVQELCDHHNFVCISMDEIMLKRSFIIEHDGTEYEFGPFDILIKPMVGKYLNKVDTDRTPIDPASGCRARPVSGAVRGSNDHSHPHVGHNNSICFGDGVVPAITTLANGLLAEYYNILEGVLENYAEDNPFEEITQFSPKGGLRDPEECYRCGNLIHFASDIKTIDNKVYCPKCVKTVDGVLVRVDHAPADVLTLTTNHIERSRGRSEEDDDEDYELSEEERDHIVGATPTPQPRATMLCPTCRITVTDVDAMRMDVITGIAYCPMCNNNLGGSNIPQDQSIETWLMDFLNVVLEPAHVECMALTNDEDHLIHARRMFNANSTSIYNHFGQNNHKPLSYYITYLNNIAGSAIYSPISPEIERQHDIFYANR